MAEAEMPEAEMAEAGIPANDAPNGNVKSARRFMELFHGRFNEDEARLLLEHSAWNVLQTVTFVFNSTPQEVSQFLQEVDEGQGEWQQVRPRNRRVRREQAILNQQLRQLALQNNVPSEVRQFACDPCDKSWWRKVPARKIVSKCYRCRRRYDALPRELEWGWAKFVCPCGNAFHGFGAMGRTLCLCNRCQQPVWPESIIPPRERRKIEEGRERRRRHSHSCLAPNCYRRTHFTPLLGFNVDDLICVHPRSLERAVVEESEVHQSTGSTVDTFLTQDDLDTHDPLGVYIPREPSIREDDGDGQ